MKWWLQSGRQRQLWILFASLLPTFIFVAVLIPLSTPPSNWIFAEYPTCNTCTLYQGKNPTQQNWSNLTAILTCWVMGKRCPKQQQKVVFSIRWVLRDRTSVFLAFLSTLKIQSLKELYCTTFLQNVFTQGQSMDYLPPLQQSLKLSATEVTQHLTKWSQDTL